MKINYCVLIPSRDGYPHLEKTVTSLQNQTVKPKTIFVIDDASNLKSVELIKHLPVTHIRYPKRYPKNFNRVPKLLNMALPYIKEVDYLMISGDDTFYPKNYAEQILTQLENEKDVAVASGLAETEFYGSAPRGSGRFIKYCFIKPLLPFPESVAWESWTLLQALKHGYKIKVYKNTTFIHKRIYSNYSIRTFGHSAYLNGYPLISILLRLILNLKYKTYKMSQALYLLLGYIEYLVSHKPRQKDTANFNTKYEYRRIFQAIISLGAKRGYHT